MNGYFQYGQSQQGYTNLSYAADDDSDYYSEAQDADVNSDDGVLKPRTHDLGLSRDYVPYWTSEDAFREFYQNWLASQRQMMINLLNLTGKTQSSIPSTLMLDPSHQSSKKHLVRFKYGSTRTVLQKMDLVK